MTVRDMEICADCGKPINMHEASYYRRDPSGDIGKSYHSHCGDPFGIKAKDAEIERLQGVKRRTLAIADERAIEAVRARAENERLRAALAEYAKEENWRLNRRFDACGPNFDGITFACNAIGHEQERGR